MVSWMMTIKAVLISSGVASVGLLLKLSVPVAVDFSVSRAPILWSCFLSWLKPPYLYVVTNGIIITILASSKYYRGNGSSDREDDEIIYDGDYKIQTEPLIVQHAPPRMLEVRDINSDSHFGFVVDTPPFRQQREPETVTAYVYADEEEKLIDVVKMVEEDDEGESKEEIKSVIVAESSDPVVASGGDDDDDVILPPKMIESENRPPNGKPLVSSMIGHRKLMNPKGGKALRETKAKRNDTLENTWKMITEGKSTPLTTQLYRRSDTFGRGDSGGSEAKPLYKRSETFRDRTNYLHSPEIKKEPSLSQDELNRRVEEFIKKFNEEMKLQRMESLRQCKEITSRGL